MGRGNRNNPTSLSIGGVVDGCEAPDMTPQVILKRSPVGAKTMAA
jgi:hypothetical protein